MVSVRLPDVASLHLVSRIRGAWEWLGRADGRRHRRIAVASAGRAHIEVRGAQRPERSALVADAKSALERLDGVDWAEVDSVLGRAVIVFDPTQVSAEDLVDTIESVEDLHDATDERFPHDRPDHPADGEPIRRNVFAVVADVAGLGVATAGQALRLVRIPAEIPGLVAIVDSQPRARRLLENRFGRPAADMTLAGANALAQAFGQGPLGLMVDIGHRSGMVGELQARRNAWSRREDELLAERAHVRHGALEFPGRSVPIPQGPIEQYSDRSAIASLGSMGLVLGVTGNPRRASDLLLAGIPKAATLGRESFAAQFDRGLAAHDVIVMDPAALRRLDRVDALIIEARVVVAASSSIEDVVAFTPGADLVAATLSARALFDPTEPMSTRVGGSWMLARLSAAPVDLPRGAKTRARVLTAGGRGVLGLWHGEELIAFVTAVVDPVPGAVALVESADDSGLTVVLAGGTDAFARRLGIERRVAVGRLVDEVEELQRAGRVVMFVGAHHPAVMRAADLSLGVDHPGEHVPWAAHVMVGPGLDNVWSIVNGISTARDVSRRAVLLALGGASTGGLWALAGPGRAAAQRAMLPINATALLSIAMGGMAGRQAAGRRPPRSAPRHPWHELTPDEALGRLGSSRNGLERADQVQRRAQTTSRVLHAPVGLLRAAVDELANPLTPLLALGAALSAAVGSLTDAALVSGVVGVNALVGAAQRVQTERSLQTLEASGDTPVRVRVAGAIEEVRADELVVGDVIELATGALVPADCRLLESVALEVDESSITGESLPVAKQIDLTPGAPVAERSSMLYEGSAIAAGDAVALVVAIGIDTETGRSVAATSAAPVSGVEQRLGRLTRLTVPVTIAGGAAVAGLGFLYRRPARDAVGAGVALMVAAIPEGLPALATLAQVAAARRLASRNALVRNPRAIEALGRVDQICFDKTGTLTEGAISLVAVSNGLVEEAVDGLTEGGRAVLAAALRATPVVDGDGVLPHATDRAVAAGAVAAGVGESDALTEWRRHEETPFESRRGYHAVLGESTEDGRRISVKGAPETVLPFATSWRRGDASVPLDAASRRALEDEIDRLGRRGLRVLAVAEGATDATTRLDDDAPVSELEFLGFVAFADLVRPAARGAVAQLQRAGVRVAMITGDHASTAEAIAAELGIMDGGRVLTGADLDRLEPDELDEIIGEVVVFARVTPVQKVAIVQAYQRAGRSVAMTGDGANDAAAIRLADAGIALGGRGAPAAREMADVVVVDDRIETIVDAIVEGRAMWESVRDAVAILVGGNLGELGFTLVGAALTGTAPLNPRQLLLVNLLTDMAPALAIALREPSDRSPERLLHEGPDASLGEPLTREIAIRAGATALGATAAWGVARFTGTPTRARTVALAGLVGTQLSQTIVAGGRSPLVLGAVAVSTGALVATIQTPGVSQFFGCRPLGPVGWSTAISASIGATAASVAVPWVAARVGERIAERRTTQPARLMPLPVLPAAVPSHSAG